MTKAASTKSVKENGAHGVERHPRDLASRPTISSGKSPVLNLQRTIGNRTLSRIIEAKLKVGGPGDSYEQQADRISTQAENDSKPAQPLTEARSRQSPSGQIAGSTGVALEPGTKSFMESRFGHSLKDVRVHNDSDSGQVAQMLNARAFTIGNDVFMGENQYSPGTNEGRQLLAHELTHVLQQRSGLKIQRQVIPESLKHSVNLQKLSDKELQERYDLITATLKLFTSSSEETAPLEMEAGYISDEFSRRQAIASGRTFSNESIEKMREYFQKNATSSSPESCIACMNQGIRLLLNDPKQKMGSEVDKSMGKLEGSGRATAGRVIQFEDKKGRITTGTLRPEKLHESVWDTVIAMAGGDLGWSVFGMSLMDGYHSVTLSLNNIASGPEIYWSDQWSTKGGFKKYSKADLDTEVTRLTQGWWDPQAEGKKHNTKTTLWRLNQ
jgi:hypothetical protein